MPFTAGVFTPSIIGAAILQENQILETSRMSELKKEVVAGQAILNHQDPLITTVGFGEACMNASVYTLRSASLEGANDTLACVIPAGVAAGSEKIDLAKRVLTKPQRFFISEAICANAATAANQLAYLSLKAKIGLEVALSQALLALVNANADTPTAGWFDTTGTVTGNVYEVSGVNFTSNLLGDLQWAARVAEMSDPLILNGKNFFTKHILDQYASVGCCTNDAIFNTNQVFDIVWDPNVDLVAGAGSTLVLDKNALLFWSSPGYSNMGMESAMDAGMEANDTYHWVEILPRLKYFANGAMQDIYVDVRATKTCVLDASGTARNSTLFEYSLKGDFRLNLPNQDNRKGILKIAKV